MYYMRDAQPTFLIWGGGGAGLEAIYNLCWILKTGHENYITKCNCNITFLETGFMYL
jgi:hypothetical protein